MGTITVRLKAASCPPLPYLSTSSGSHVVLEIVMDRSYLDTERSSLSKISRCHLRKDALSTVLGTVLRILRTVCQLFLKGVREDNIAPSLILCDQSYFDEAA